MPTIKQVQQLIQLGDYTFSIDLKYAYLHFSIVKYHHHNFFFFFFLPFVWHNTSYGKVLSFVLATVKV